MREEKELDIGEGKTYSREQKQHVQSTRGKKKKKAQQAPQGQRVCRGACRGGRGGEECWREVGQGLKRVLSRVLKRKREDVISRSLNAGLRRFPVVTET